MYAFSVELKNCDFATAVDKVKAALTASKMGVISEINVAAILQKKLGIDYPDYCMLGTCAAPFGCRPRCRGFVSLQHYRQTSGRWHSGHFYAPANRVCFGKQCSHQSSGR